MTEQTGKIQIGELLLKEGLLTPDQLAQALAVQKSQIGYRPLGEICVEMRFISSLDLHRILRKHKIRIQLGELLLNLGLLSREQLQTALDQQKVEGGKLGQILIDTGMITENALVNALTIQMGVPKITPDPHLIDRKLLQGISTHFLMKNEAIPAFKENDLLTVIMSNPLDEETIRDLRKVFRCDIEPAIASSTAIRDAIRKMEGKVDYKDKVKQNDPGKGLIIGDMNLSTESGDNIVAILDYIISSAIMEGASDIHIEPKEGMLTIRYRVDGILRHKTDLPIYLATNLISRIKILCGLDIAEKRRHQDGRIEARVNNIEVDLRISVYVSIYGENVVMRILHRKTHLIDLDSIGFSPANRANYQKVLDQPSGVILVTGPTGSGKTTTLYASLNYLNNGQRAIITVEDPVEYTIEGVVQGQLNTKIGQTHMDFLRSMMRQDPDVIMVGEIRDQIAAEAVIQTALTGHKVLSTFHTDDTTGALLRLMDMGIDTFLISSTVVSVIAQRLIRVLCERCRRPYLPDQRLLVSFNIGSMDLKKFTFYEAVGCDDCGGSGFKGRIGIHEFLLVNEDIRDAILARKTSSQIRFVAREKAEFISLREDGFYKATQGITSLDEILRVVFHNEGDTSCPRSAEDIVALCEGRKPAAPSGLIPFRVQDTIPLEEEKVLLLLKGTESILLEGEAYRVRFETSVIEIEIPVILDFFNAYIALMDKMGLVVDPGMAERFVDIIVHTVKRLEVSVKAEFVEIILRVRQGKVKIEAETLVPQEHFFLPAVASREKGRRLINFLMPPSGIGHALIAENNLIRKGTPVQKRYSLVNILKEGKSGRMKREDLDGPGVEELEAYLPRGISALYRKHLEEVEVDPILI